MSAVDRLLETAIAEDGYLEKKSNSQLDSKTANAGSNNYTKYARDLDNMGVYNGNKNGYAWCDVFVDWCFITTFGLDMGMKLTCQPIGGLGAGCTYSANYYKQNNQFHTKNPKAGDQIFFTDSSGGMSHTGIVTKVDSSKVYTIEGNTSSASGVIANGGCVRQKSYSLSYSRIGGYGRPDYSLVGDDEEVTQEQFNKMMEVYLTQLAEKDGDSWSQSAREWAESTGLIKGDANGNKQYKNFCTREAMVVFLKRFHDMGL